MSVEIFFFGLDQIGTSIGMALAETDLDIVRIGHDPDRQRARRAQELGAIQRLVSHPRNAPKSADLVIMDVPTIDVRAYLEMLAKNLKPEGVVIDTTPFRSQVTSWADEMFPDDRYYVGATPVIGPDSLLEESRVTQEPDADIFRGGLLALTISKNTPQQAVTACLNLAAVLGATPFFLDPHEHDGVSASVEGLPLLVAAAMMQSSVKATNWRDIQRMGGVTFANLTGLCTTQPADVLGGSLSLNREILLAKLDTFVEELHHLRELLTEENGQSLEDYFADATTARASWLSARRKGDWAGQDIVQEPQPTKRGFIGNLFGIRPRDDKKRK
ncbi:MAG: prephenate dehydrogenase/arogenate dehydrogenase family protein [Anaerolineales bacterium]|nr:prephenate dehydrogenase/arogenate dehydrogenase family protein [Anaerolineales bacterium]